MNETLRPWYKRPWPVVGLLFLVLLLLGVGSFGVQVFHYWSLLKSGNPDAIRAEHAKASMSRAFQAKSDVSAADIDAVMRPGNNPTLGNLKAAVHIVELVDYGCPFCRQTAPIMRAFMQTHRDDAFLVLKDFPLTDLHPQALDVAIAARCVFDQGNLPKFWNVHDRLFAGQDAQTADDLRLYAQQAGVDLETYDRCIVAQSPLNEIQSSLDTGVTAGAEGTPTFFFNGVKIQGAMDAALMEAAFQEALKKTER